MSESGEKNLTLNELCGKHTLQGVEYRNDGYSDILLFKLDGITYKATEDPEDGYRSHMEELEVVEQPPRYAFETEVVCSMREARDAEILEMRDTQNGKTILRIGTENTWDYYPYCVMEWMPQNMSCNQED
jgi:hypothetical protein